MEYAIIDLEATCWEHNDPNFDDHEIIEIGVVFLNEKYEKTGELDIFVRPYHNPILSEYCIDLTGITQNKINTEGIEFERAMMLLSEEISRRDVLFCSWGLWDKTQLVDACKAFDVPYPFNDNHLNIKAEFLQKHNKKKCGLQKACRIYQLRFNGSPHSGIDDANMTSEVFRHMRKEE